MWLVTRNKILLGFLFRAGISFYQDVRIGFLNKITRYRLHDRFMNAVLHATTNGSETHSGTCPTGQRRTVELTTNLHLIPSPTMRAVLTPLPYTPSWV